MVFCLWVQDVLYSGNSVCGCGYTVTHPQHNIVPPCLVQSHDTQQMYVCVYVGWVG